MEHLGLGLPAILTGADEELPSLPKSPTAPRTPKTTTLGRFGSGPLRRIKYGDIAAASKTLAHYRSPTPTQERDKASIDHATSMLQFLESTVSPRYHTYNGFWGLLASFFSAAFPDFPGGATSTQDACSVRMVVG